MFKYRDWTGANVVVQRAVGGFLEWSNALQSDVVACSGRSRASRPIMAKRALASETLALCPTTSLLPTIHSIGTKFHLLEAPFRLTSTCHRVVQG